MLGLSLRLARGEALRSGLGCRKARVRRRAAGSQPHDYPAARRTRERRLPHMRPTRSDSPRAPHCAGSTRHVREHAQEPDPRGVRTPANAGKAPTLAGGSGAWRADARGPRLPSRVARQRSLGLTTEAAPGTRRQAFAAPQAEDGHAPLTCGPPSGRPACAAARLRCSGSPKKRRPGGAPSAHA